MKLFRKKCGYLLAFYCMISATALQAQSNITAAE
jgi:hypothetical protein